MHELAYMSVCLLKSHKIIEGNLKKIEKGVWMDFTNLFQVKKQVEGKIKILLVFAALAFQWGVSLGIKVI